MSQGNTKKHRSLAVVLGFLKSPVKKPTRPKEPNFMDTHIEVQNNSHGTNESSTELSSDNREKSLETETAMQKEPHSGQQGGSTADEQHCGKPEKTTKEKLREWMKVVKERAAAASETNNEILGDEAAQIVAKAQKKRQYFQGTLLLKVVGAINIPCEAKTVTNSRQTKKTRKLNSIEHESSVCSGTKRKDLRTTMQCCVALAGSGEAGQVQHTKTVSVGPTPTKTAGVYTYAPEWQDAFCFEVTQLTMNSALRVQIVTPSQSSELAHTGCTRISNDSRAHTHGSGTFSLGPLVFGDVPEGEHKSRRASVPLGVGMPCGSGSSRVCGGDGGRGGQLLLVWKFHMLLPPPNQNTAPHPNSLAITSQADGTSDRSSASKPFEDLAMQLSSQLHMLEVLFTHRQEVNT
jgi:hypothetical protein